MTVVNDQQLNFLNMCIWWVDLHLVALGPGEGNGTPLQYPCLENPMNGGAWKAAVHGVSEGQTWLSEFTFTFHFHALEKEMATHSGVLAWRIPGMGHPGGLPSMGSQRVGHDWSDLAAAAAAAALGPLFTRVSERVRVSDFQMPIMCYSICRMLEELNALL